jgi:hypothetical protein
MPAVVSGFTVTEKPYGSAISYGSVCCMTEHPPKWGQA